MVLRLTRQVSGRTIPPALKEVETAGGVPAFQPPELPRTSRAHITIKGFGRSRRGEVCPMDFGGRAWKEALPAKLPEPVSRRRLTAELTPHLARATAGRTLQGPPPRNRRLFRVSSSRAISRCRASIRSTRSNGRSARRSSATKRARSSSSSATSRSRSSGPSRRPTSSSRSISAARWGRPSASTASSS